jgi:hypothetical protein
MKKLVWILALAAVVGCQKAELGERKNDGGRGTEKEAFDTIDVDVDAVPDGWAGSIDVGFEFG